MIWVSRSKRGHCLLPLPTALPEDLGDRSPQLLTLTTNAHLPAPSLKGPACPLLGTQDHSGINRKLENTYAMYLPFQVTFLKYSQDSNSISLKKQSLASFYLLLVIASDRWKLRYQIIMLQLSYLSKHILSYSITYFSCFLLLTLIRSNFMHSRKMLLSLKLLSC